MAKKAKRDLGNKFFLFLSLLNVRSLKNKCCRQRDIVIENSIDMFCMSETWLYDDDFDFLRALTPDFNVLHHVPSPDKKVAEVGCLINKSLQSKRQHTKSFKCSECMEVHI